MAEWYYTDLWNNPIGPLDNEGLLELNDNGTIHAETPVWREGMNHWTALASMASELFPKGEGGTPTPVGICAYSGKIIPEQKMIRYGPVLVDPAQKREFVQSLMEDGKPINEAAGEQIKKYVGFWWRLLAVLLDETIKWAIMTIAILVLAAVAGAILKFIPSVSFESIFNSEADDTIPAIFVGMIALITGLVFILSNAVYEIWMIGKHQATVGKMVIGARVLRPDDSRVSYWRSLGRWFVKCPISLELAKVLPIVMFYIFIGFIAVGASNGTPVMVISSIFLGTVFPIVFGVATSAVFWMAAFDPEKRALHDRIAATRVVLRRAILEEEREEPVHLSLKQQTNDEVVSPPALPSISGIELPTPPEAEPTKSSSTS